MVLFTQDFPGGSDGKASVYNAGNPGLSPGLGRSPGEGNGNPLQYYCLENPMDRGAWQATVRHDFTFTFIDNRDKDRFDYIFFQVDDRYTQHEEAVALNCLIQYVL